MLRPTFARKCIDITWKTLLDFIWTYLTHSETALQTESEIETLWNTDQTLTTFTVRSGFDLCLQAYAFPPGSEIIVSAVTIPDMVRITKHHNLIVVPVDIQDDGSVSVVDIESLITVKTKAILIAHLFGNRMEFYDIANAAKQRGLVVFEDCAQAFRGRQFTGCELADVSMFSFGLIKTSTAFGGGILTIRDEAILFATKAIQARYPRQNNSKFWSRLAKYSVFKALTGSPVAYGLFLAIVNLLGLDHHAFIRNLSRSFVPSTLMLQIRQKPSPPLLRLLKQRISTFQISQLEAHQSQVSFFSSLLPEDCRPVGIGGKRHVYWLCPIRVPRPDVFVSTLYRSGFDAADGGTSLTVVSCEHGVVPANAQRIMKSIVYVPMNHVYAVEQMRRLAELVILHKETHMVDY